MLTNVPKRIYWSSAGKLDVDLDDPAQKGWWIKQVLLNGTMYDVQKLDLEEVEAWLPRLYLPRPIASLWRDFFARRHSRAASQESAEHL